MYVCVRMGESGCGDHWPGLTEEEVRSGRVLLEKRDAWMGGRDWDGGRASTARGLGLTMLCCCVP